jgi:hypothetical protein
MATNDRNAPASGLHVRRTLTGPPQFDAQAGAKPDTVKITCMPRRWALRKRPS